MDTRHRKRVQGVVKALTNRKFGFLSVPTEKTDLFFHSKELVGIVFDELKVGQVVYFSVVKGDRGPAAKEVGRDEDFPPAGEKPSEPPVTGLIVFVDAGDELLKTFRRHPHLMKRTTARGFEQLMAAILRTHGFVVQLTKQTRDGGYDIVATKHDSLGISTKYIVECKRWADERRVGVEVVRALYGAKGETSANHAVLATTSDFTADALAFSRRPTVSHLHLRNLDGVTEWLEARAP